MVPLGDMYTVAGVGGPAEDFTEYACGAPLWVGGMMWGETKSECQFIFIYVLYYYYYLLILINLKKRTGGKNKKKQ